MNEKDIYNSLDYTEKKLIDAFSEMLTLVNKEKDTSIEDTDVSLYDFGHEVAEIYGRTLDQLFGKEVVDMSLDYLENEEDKLERKKDIQEKLTEPSNNFKALYNKLIEKGLFTEEELNIVCNRNGFTIITLNEYLYARYGYHDLNELQEYRGKLLPKGSYMIHQRRRNKRIF
jgi:hypothetical protein